MNILTKPWQLLQISLKFLTFSNNNLVTPKAFFALVSMSGISVIIIFHIRTVTIIKWLLPPRHDCIKTYIQLRLWFYCTARPYFPILLSLPELILIHFGSLDWGVLTSNRHLKSSILLVRLRHLTNQIYSLLMPS